MWLLCIHLLSYRWHFGSEQHISFFLFFFLSCPLVWLPQSVNIDRKLEKEWLAVEEEKEK